MQTPNVSASEDTQYVFPSRAQLIFRHQRTITHRLDGYLNRLETCSGAWALDSLPSSSAGWERTCCPWRPRGSLSSPGTLRTHTEPWSCPCPLPLPTDTSCHNPRGSFVLCIQRAVENTNGKGRAGISTLFPGQKGDFLGGGQKQNSFASLEGVLKQDHAGSHLHTCVLPKIFCPSPCLGSHQLVRTMVDTDCMKNQAKKPQLICSNSSMKT